MRLKISLLLSALVAVASAQVWEKPIAPGLVYRMEVDAATPRIIHALRFTPGSPTKATPELAEGTVYRESPTKGRATVSEMVAATGALAGINGDYFPYTGDPLGAMVRNGEMLSIPAQPRSSFGWNNTANGFSAGILSWKGSFEAKGQVIQFDNLNGDCGANQIAVNTVAAGFSVAKTPNVHVFVKLDEGTFAPNGTASGTVTGMTADLPTYPVAENSVVIVATGNKTGNVTNLRAGDKVTFKLQSDGIDWSKVDQLISGGPFLVKDGAVFVDAEAQKFNSEFSKKRHPRSAVGRSANGDFWFVAVDGRQKMSEGATLQEMAEVMAKLGCRDAINLDGGGSTDLNILGVVVNRPSDGKERPVANGVLFYGPAPAKTEGNLNIEGPATFDQTGTVTLKAVENGKPVNDSEVIWSAQGAAWIDQGGLLHPWKTGPVSVVAWIKGHLVSKEINIISAEVKNARTAPVTSRAGDRNSRTKTTPVKPAVKPPKKKGKGG